MPAYSALLGSKSFVLQAADRNLEHGVGMLDRMRILLKMP